jgi:DNA modification methylase
VATRLGRQWLGIEINPAFATLAKERLRKLSKQRAGAEKAA